MISPLEYAVKINNPIWKEFHAVIKHIKDDHIKANYLKRFVQQLESGAQSRFKTKFNVTPDIFGANLNDEEDFKNSRLQLGIRFPSDICDAAIKGNVSTVKALLDEGIVDPNYQNRNRQTPLLLASFKQLEVVKLLLEKGANPNIADKSNLTPLLKAATGGDNEIVNKLIEYGAKINHQGGEMNDTALHKAALYRHLENR